MCEALLYYADGSMSEEKTHTRVHIHPQVHTQTLETPRPTIDLRRIYLHTDQL